MADYHVVDISDLDEGSQMRLGRVFVSKEAQRFLDAMTNGEGAFQLGQALRAHALAGERSRYQVGDVLHLETDVAGRTFVWIQSEAERPPELPVVRKEVREHVEDSNREA